MQELGGIDDLVALVETRAGELSSLQRLVVGLAGLPGVGKSTTADELSSRLRARGLVAALLPMDGFHLRNEVLREAGIRDRKGAPDTFDAYAFTLALAEAKAGHGKDLRFPEFDRDHDEPVSDGALIPSDTCVVITEGNYLLVPDEPWNLLRASLDITVYLTLDNTVRMNRLVARHRRYGMKDTAARAWASGPDEANRAVIEASARYADYTLAVG